MNKLEIIQNLTESLKDQTKSILKLSKVIIEMVEELNNRENDDKSKEDDTFSTENNANESDIETVDPGDVQETEFQDLKEPVSNLDENDPISRSPVSNVPTMGRYY